MNIENRLKKLEEKLNVNDKDTIKEITINVINADGSTDTILVSHKKGNAWTEFEEMK